MSTTALRIEVNGMAAVSGILQIPEMAIACYVMAHGAGAGMTHPFMAAVADGLAERRVATLRYQFPSMERGSKRPDKPALAQATVRAAVAVAARLVPSLPLFAGGKSFGGRMTSQAQAEAALPAVQGLVFFGFPLHPAKKPSDTRAAHLFRIDSPMLFLQGTRDALADMTLLEAVVEKLGQRASLFKVDDGDHAFHVPRRSGRADAEVLAEMLDEPVRWIAATARR
ncbi:MAG: alpha/beta hydrolase [Acetobacteraceae bacterium]|nr:MAG: alpha/beta hydrolase [Acetobacteraceae bacterium]